MKVRDVLGHLVLAAGLAGLGCDQGAESFSLAWSEYPSWSVFGVAHEKGLIDGARGKRGPIEKKWGVDIELKEMDYDSCLQLYGSGGCDAVCITNMDALPPAVRRKSVAVLPTSTSAGADACITVGIDSIQELRGHKVYGLEKSVSEYCFFRNLELLGEKESDHAFENLDPGAAALALQQGQKDIQAIMVWNPFVLETLKKRQEAKVLFDSSSIPGEIIDMVVAGQDSLARPGGEAFAHAVIDTYYEMNRMLEDPNTGDQTLVALGARFSSLGLEDMKKVVRQTLFYKTPREALALFKGDKLKDTMKTVVDFCVKRRIVESPPAVGYGSAGDAPEARLRFDPAFIEEVAGNRQ